MIAPPDDGPMAGVWTRLRRLPIERRNEVVTVDADDAGAVAIPCSGRTHHGHVRGGAFVLDDHDVDAELALLALGSEVPGCLLYLAVWHQSLIDGSFLLAWGDDVDGDGLRAAREDWEGNYWESWPLEPPAGRVLFGPRLQRAVALAAARRASDDADHGDIERWYALQRATQTRARSAFVSSLAEVDAHPRPDALIPVRIHVDPFGDGATIRGRLARLGSAVELVLPFDWLWTVWTTSGGLIDGRFVLADDGTEVAVVAWERSGRPEREHLPEVVRRPR